MNLNAESTKKITELQNKKKNETDFYKDNRFIALAFSIQGGKSTIVSSLIQELEYSLDEVSEYIDALLSLNVLSKSDISLIEKISLKSKKKESYESTMEKIIEDFNKVSGKRVSLTATKRKNLKRILSTKKYTVEDFKIVHRYFMSTWGKSPVMQKHLNPDTLYNTKFEDRVEQAREHKENLTAYKEEITRLYKNFTGLFEMETQMVNTQEKIRFNPEILEKSFLDIDLDIEKIPYKIQDSIILWLKKGYTIDIIEATIKETIKSWSKNKDYAPHISLTKILDEKFNQRAMAVLRILESNNKPSLKQSASAIDEWGKNMKGNFSA